MTRREQLYPEIKRLREDEGLVWREIGERLGLALTTVQDYYIDPTGEASTRRKAQYAHPCLDCGKTINGNGPGRLSMRCATCHGAHTRAMTRQWVIDSFREWFQRFGAPPSAIDWNPARARSGYCGWKAERYERSGRKWPPTNTVRNNFGSWNEGLKAAGFDPLDPSEHWLGHAGRTLRDQDRAAA